MSEILTRLKAATAGGSNLDEDVLKELGYALRRVPMDSVPYWTLTPAGQYPLMALREEHEHPTTSLDAALALVEAKLPEHVIELTISPNLGASVVRLLPLLMSGLKPAKASAPTAPLALLIALFTALEPSHD